VQLGEPLAVYRHPADTFVARFLGNPPMNLLPGRLETADGTGIVRFAGVALRSARNAASLAPHAGRDVTIGIRPEDIYETAPSGSSREFARMPVRVVTVEPLGAETLLVLSLEGSGDELVARVGRDTALRSGDRHEFALDVATLHLFDPATTKAIV
jgi:ABC-type sugar transport system ATPase subunit